eukprot:355749-Chlamydomonas_euryale.AAC.5
MHSYCEGGVCMRTRYFITHMYIIRPVTAFPGSNCLYMPACCPSDNGGVPPKPGKPCVTPSKANMQVKGSGMHMSTHDVA